MLSKEELEREREEARLRVQRDESIRQKAARLYAEEGFKKGKEEGRKEVLVESIHRFQRGLKRDVTPPEHLQVLSVEELRALLDQLLQDALNARTS